MLTRNTTVKFPRHALIKGEKGDFEKGCRKLNLVEQALQNLEQTIR